MPDLALRYNLSEASFAKTLALRGVAQSGTTEAFAAEIYWRWNDDPDMPLQLYGKGRPGTELSQPWTDTGREVYLAMISIYEGQSPGLARDFSKAVTMVFTPPAKLYTSSSEFETSESILAFALVNIWNDGGTPKVRNADATDDTRPCHGFVREASAGGGSSFGPSESVRVYFVGNIIETTGRTPGAIQYLRAANGEMTETAPVTSGNIVQQIGVAISPTQVIFDPEEYTKIP